MTFAATVQSPVFSGFLKIDGTVYYAGVSETSDMYLVPVARRSGKIEGFIVSLKMALYAVITSLIIILLTLHRYQRDVLDGAPPEEGDLAMEPQVEAEPAAEPEGAARGLFSGFSNLIRVQEKEGLEERWHGNYTQKGRQTPEQRIGRIIYWLLLLFCLFVLLPTLYMSFDHSAKGMELNMPIAYDAELPEVEEALAEELPKLMDVIPGLVKPPAYEGVESFEDSSVLLRIAIYVDNSVKYPALRALRREVKLIFDRRGIEIPFNQLVIHEGKGDGDGAARLTKD